MQPLSLALAIRLPDSWVVSNYWAAPCGPEDIAQLLRTRT